MSLKVYAQSSPWNKAVELLIFEDRDDKHYRGSLTFSEVEEGVICQPTLSIRPTEAQLLMDNLWQCGYRPSEGTGSAGQLAATQKHLEDMRTLVFRK